MNWNLVTFADKKFTDKQEFVNTYGKNNGLTPLPYSFDWLKTTDFYSDNIELFNESVGVGYFCWKPYIILDAMNKLNDGDMIFYCDTNDLFHPDLFNCVEKLLGEDDCLLVLGGFPNKDWTKRDCFVFMDCDEQDYWNSIQIEAGISFWKVSDESKKVVQEWLKYCIDRRIISDDDNVSGKDNFPTFQNHRWDQSVLTNIALKYGLSVVGSEIRDYIECNCDYWFERNKKTGFTLGRPIDKILQSLKEEYNV